MSNLLDHIRDRLITLRQNLAEARAFGIDTPGFNQTLGAIDELQMLLDFIATEGTETMTKLYRATLETRHFSFEAVSKTAEGALEALNRGIDIHCRQYNAISSAMRDEYAGHIIVQPLVIDTPYRDGEALT